MQEGRLKYMHCTVVGRTSPDRSWHVYKRLNWAAANPARFYSARTPRLMIVVRAARQTDMQISLTKDSVKSVQRTLSLGTEEMVNIII